MLAWVIAIATCPSVCPSLAGIVSKQRNAVCAVVVCSRVAVFVSDPQMYSTVRVISSVVKSGHKAVVVMSEPAVKFHCKNNQRRSFRPKSPYQNAACLQHLKQIDLSTDHLPTDTQAAFDSFYSMALGLLDCFYPQRTITLSSRDPSYMTPEIKAKLRRKNRLMRSGRVKDASALARRIGRDIDWHCQQQLRKINGKADSKDLWSAVKNLMGRKSVITPLCQLHRASTKTVAAAQQQASCPRPGLPGNFHSSMHACVGRASRLTSARRADVIRSLSRRLSRRRRVERKRH